MVIRIVNCSGTEFLIGCLKDGWMKQDFMSFFNSISVISGHLVGDNERLCATEPFLG